MFQNRDMFEDEINNPLKLVVESFLGRKQPTQKILNAWRFFLNYSKLF